MWIMQYLIISIQEERKILRWIENRQSRVDHAVYILLKNLKSLHFLEFLIPFPNSLWSENVIWFFFGKRAGPFQNLFLSISRPSIQLYVRPLQILNPLTPYCLLYFVRKIDKIDDLLEERFHLNDWAPVWVHSVTSTVWIDFHLHMPFWWLCWWFV